MKRLGTFTNLIAIELGILHPVLTMGYLDRLSECEKGRASALFYLCFDLGIGLGMWLLSPALEWFSLREVFLIAEYMALAGVAIVRPVAERLTAVDQISWDEA